MRSTALTLVLSCLPALAFAQQASTSASASAQANVTIPAHYSQEARARITAAFERARERNVPDDQMRQRLAEGEAKGASDAQVATAVQKSEARLETSQSLLIKSGRSNPRPEEINNAALALEQGVAESRIVAAITNPPANASVAASLGALIQVPAASASAAGSVTGAVSGAAAGATAGVTGAVTGAVTRPPTF